MSKKPNLAAALAASKAEVSQPTEVASKPQNNAATNARPAGRVGQTNISGWFDSRVKFTLEELRLKRQRELGRRVTIQELMGEAYNDLFKKYGFPEVAPSRSDA